MSPSQMQTIQRITANAQEWAKSLCDVPMVWQVHEGFRYLELRGSNHDCERRWHDSGRVYQAFIGVRGGVTMSSATDSLYRGLK